MIKNSKKYRNYVPYTFWAMDQELFFKYANELEEDDRGLLSYFPFKKGLTPDKPEITNYKRHMILKLGQINSK